MKLIETKIAGCYEIQPVIFNDGRGRFVKTFHQDIFAQNNLNLEWQEEYYSTSHKNVIRGMHFQLPPHDHEKLVYCSVGAVLDVVVDLRKSSSTHQQHIMVNLSSELGNMLYIPKGCAHGFKSLQDNTVMMYKVSTVYNSDADYGIAWDSCGVDWQLSNTLPIISKRDNSFNNLDVFASPF
ncbi:MAG: dTDP-4-dehydrorhamnose 3,5-epimerase [Sphingobacteriaceae bacterium]|nr:dTDP-4-dehydrorhamnose 3,5-epimerase [Sphingobacteriaceae bacterium]